MARLNMKERTVQFYEVVEADSGQQVRVGQRNWAEILGEIARAKIDERTCEAGNILVGTVHTHEDEDYLLLHRVKQPGEWLSVMDMATGHWRELESKASEGYLETTAIAFLPYGNLVGIMQGSVSSPTHKSLETWINGLKLFTKPVVVRPVLSKAEVDKLSTASGAAKVEIRIGQNRAAVLQQKTGRLARFLRAASAEYGGDIRVTMTISIPRGGGDARDEDRSRLLDDLRDLQDVMPGAAAVARARLIYSDPGGAEHSRLSEFVEHHITAKRRVPAVDEAGHSIKILSAVLVIMEVAAEFEDELRLAADVPD
ncbi:hypothetical protein GCM10009557_26910 [Virgisporangium ochraceum]|uniref:Uncharacterized protein n=1 Tax=Virgisporangium ochraceum TaxID=65505 RepID=A0A8J3ZMD6_9ACTN|nr:hypothetical protein [Virgisporangium ochraceum]GIJ65632.1 hypothetical protein Voc01_005490 [Virgisporangium ochraceum]